MCQRVWKPAVLTWVKKPAPSSTAMLTWLPPLSLSTHSEDEWNLSSESRTILPTSRPVIHTLAHSVSQLCPYLNLTGNIPLRGKSKVPSAQVTEWNGRGRGEKKKEKCTDKSEHRRKRIQGLLPLTGRYGAHGMEGRWEGGQRWSRWGKGEKRKVLSDSRRVSKQSAEHHLAECHAARQIPSAASQSPSSPLWLSLPL